MDILTKDGQKRPVLLSAGSVLDTQGNLLFSTSVQTDVYDFKDIHGQLREQQVRLNAVVAPAVTAVIATDADQRIVVFNPAAERMFHCSAKEAIGSALDRFIPPRFRDAHKSHVREFGKTGITFRTMGALPPFRALRANGEEFPIEASISEVDVAGKKLFTAIIRGITERRQAEEALARNSTIVKSSTDAIVSMDSEGVLLSWNPAAQRMYGYAKEEAIGKSIAIIIPSNLYRGETDILRHIGAGERIENYETVRISKSGKKIAVSITASPIPGPDGREDSLFQ